MTLSPQSIAAVAIILAAIAVAWMRRFPAAGCLAVANIAILILVYAAPNPGCPGGGNAIHCELALDRDVLLDLQPLGVLQLVTSMFVHFDFGHILGNLVILLFFALPFEERIGPRAFTVLYLGTGLMGSLAEVAVHGDAPLRLMGASGAVFGVIGAFAARYPNLVVPLPVPLLVMMIVARLRVWVGAMLFAVVQVLSLLFISGYDNVAYTAHLAGLAGGLLVGTGLAMTGTGARQAVPVDLERLRPFAQDTSTSEALRNMEANRDEPAVFQAWLDRFLRGAKCPTCQHRVLPHGGGEVMCTKGHRFDVRATKPQAPTPG